MGNDYAYGKGCIRLKVEEVLKEIKRFKLEVVVLTEAKMKGKGASELKDFVHFYSGDNKDKRVAAVVSILIRKSLSKSITDWELVNERLIKIYVKLKGHDLVVVGAYSASEDGKDEVKDKFYNDLTDLVDGIGSRKLLVLLGDLNARTGKTMTR